MLTVQLGVPAAEAFARLRAYAYSQDRRLADVAGDIVARRLRLHPGPGPETAAREVSGSAGRRPCSATASFPATGERMTQMDTELLSDTFVDLADTMVADFDIIDFLHMLTDRSVALLAASAAGVVLADPRGELRVAAASSEAAGLLELFQMQNDQGPVPGMLPHRPARHRELTSPGRPSGGPGSPPPPRGPGSAPWRPCRCGCGTRSSAR